MHLTALKRHWERLGRRDPLWAALTHRDKTGGGWDTAAFFHNGVEELAAVLERAERLGIVVSPRRALDFGCGAGRITQAMARRFDRSDGVDISSSMLAVAARHNAFPGRCVYHLNVAPDLSLFAEGTFSFVYSTLVLQHMEPQYSRHYIRELLRVLAPGGLLVFQLPGHMGAVEPSSRDESTASAGRLPPAAFQARLIVDGAALSAEPEELLTIPVTVENRSPHRWPARGDARGRFQIRLANHWLDEDGTVVRRDDGRSPLPHDVAPSGRAELLLGVAAPDTNGDYWIELDLVQEDISWFADLGSPTVRLACRVTGGRPRPVIVKSRRDDTGPVLFRDRHPRLFRLLRITGLRDTYWAWRRVLDRVRARRDRLIVAARYPLVINWWRNRPFAPRMEMHCVPRREVLAIVQEQGARVADVEEELMPGGFHSYRYWVCKP